MKTTLLSAFALLFIVYQSFSQIAVEDFNDSQLPEGWSSITNSGNCSWNEFTRITPRGQNFSSTALLYDDDACGQNGLNNNVSIVTSSYDVANINALLLSVEIGLQSESATSGESLTIEVYDGSAWQTIETFTGDWIPYNYQADVTAYANAAFKVRFTYDDNSSWGLYAAIDNFKLSEESLPQMPPQVTCNMAEVVTPGVHTVNPIQRGYAPETCSNAKGGAWFSYTAAIDGVATVSSILSQNEEVDTNVNILTGSCDNLECYAQNDDANNLFFSTVSFEVAAGSTYFIVFDDKNDNRGFDFSLEEAEEACNEGNSVAVDFSDRENFETCHTVYDGDGNERSWVADAADFKRDGNITYFATNAANGDTQKDDYLFSPKLTLTGGESYPISFTYNASSTPFYEANETLQVLMATSPDTEEEMTLIYEATNITQQGDDASSYDNAFHITDQEFTPESSGDYYLVFRTISEAPSGQLQLFDYTFGNETLSTKPVPSSSKLEHFYNTNTDVLNIKARENLSNIQLFSLSGQLIHTIQLNGNEAEVNLYDLANGIYIARVSTQKNIQSFKILNR